MATLHAAHEGYRHQDAVTALVAAQLLLPRTTDRSIASDHKVIGGDRFDDLAVHGLDSCRIQIKAHATDTRQIELADLTTKQIDFRIDDAIRSVVDDPSPADEYRLFVTFGSPDESLAPFVRSASDIDALVSGLATNRFRLDAEQLWPSGGTPAWRHIESFGRPAVVDFCDRFVIETGCPRSSGDLRNPGPLDAALLTFLQDRIGVGRPPNNRRDLGDAAAHLIYFAQAMRASGGSRVAEEVVSALALQVDFGRVEEQLPLDPARLVERPEQLDELVSAVDRASRVVVTGPPGAGKSWLLHVLRERLRADGWVVAAHFCFIDLLDQARERRTSIDTMFGSVIAELLDADPSLASDSVARFAAGPTELEEILRAGRAERPDRRIAIIVDGLDHADRVLLKGTPGAAADISQELTSLDLPNGVALVIGSQPGDHLVGLLDDAASHPVDPWSAGEVDALTRSAGVQSALEEFGLDVAPVVSAIIERANGNPLYATYLSRTAIQVVQGESPAGDDVDIAALLRSAPPFDADLDAYYGWLLGALSTDTGVLSIVQLLSMLDFALSAEEIGEIHPQFAHHVTRVLSRLSPVLAEDASLGGVRVYHESFQRYIRDGLRPELGVDVEAVVAPAIQWLERRGFFSDKRAFRSLLSLLATAGRHRQVLDLVNVAFVADAAAHGQPGDAVAANLTIAASSAVSLRSWADLSRLVEVARAADYLYNWRFDDDTLAEAYGRTFAAIHGPAELEGHLLHEGRCTFRPRPGLVLCRLCEEHGIAPPWEEYLAAHDNLRRTDNTSYGSGELAINLARLTGRLRLAGEHSARTLATRWLRDVDRLPVHPHDVAYTLGELYGLGTVEALVATLDAGERRAWCRLAAAALSADVNSAAEHANAALRDSLPAGGLRMAVSFGADPAECAMARGDLDELTAEVRTREVRLQDDLMDRWLAELDIASALGDDIALFRAESTIPADSWYHRWLRFAVALRRDLSNETILSELGALSRDVQPFQGDPRVCDLYPIHEDIRNSFRRTLERLDDDEQWCAAVDALAELSSGTTTWLQGSRSGPLPLDDLLELLLDTADSESKGKKAAALASALLAPEDRTGEFYDGHAQEEMLLARLHLAAGDRDAALQAWKEACLYLAGYGWRKDITVYEVLDSLEALPFVSPGQMSEALQKVQPIMERVLTHTDGKETRHAIHQWIDTAARLDPAGALFHLAREAISGAPHFGGLDHAMPIALEALDGHLGDAILAAGWIAAGKEAHERVVPALSIAERLPSSTAWPVVVASLSGDGELTAKGAAAVAASAKKGGRETPTLNYATEDSPVTSEDDEASPPPAPGAFELLPSTPVLQIAHKVRRWRDEHGGAAQPSAVIAAVSARLLALESEEHGADAEALMRRIARDTPLWERNDFLAGLASALAEGGAGRLSAIAGTFAYTRARDGWRSFGGERAQDAFLAALKLDAEIAWATLADEVAAGIARGGDTGINVHLIELLAAGGLDDEAGASWSEACNAILFRVPRVGPVDDIGIVYDPQPPNAFAALCCAVTSRLNHVLVDERRAALSAAAMLVSFGGPEFGQALVLAAESGTTSVLVPLLEITAAHEPAPYDASRFATDSLVKVAAGDLASARVLARRLLERIGEEPPSSVPTPLPPAPALSDARAAALARDFGSARTDPVDEVWPSFTRRVAEQYGNALKSPELTRRMQSALRRLRRRDRVGRQPRIWLPIDEEQERILQVVGGAARAALAIEGVLDPTVEDDIGSLLMGQVGLGVRMALSRIPRPSQYEPPSEALSFAVSSDPTIVPGGDFAGWVAVGHHERQLVVGDGYDTPVLARPEAWSALTYVEGPVDLSGNLPMSHGISQVWESRAPMGATPGRFLGPAVGFDIVRDAFGVAEVLTPHPVLILAAGLQPAPFEQGLALLDAAGEPALVCRQWRESPLGTDEIDDHEYRLEGMELLAREDVIRRAAAWSTGDPVTVSIATGKPDAMVEPAQ